MDDRPPQTPSGARVPRNAQSSIPSKPDVLGFDAQQVGPTPKKDKQVIRRVQKRGSKSKKLLSVLSWSAVSPCLLNDCSFDCFPVVSSLAYQARIRFAYSTLAQISPLSGQSYLLKYIHDPVAPTSRCGKAPPQLNVAGKCFKCDGNHKCTIKYCPQYEQAVVDKTRSAPLLGFSYYLPRRIKEQEHFHSRHHILRLRGQPPDPLHYSWHSLLQAH